MTSRFTIADLRAKRAELVGHFSALVQKNEHQTDEEESPVDAAMFDHWQSEIASIDTRIKELNSLNQYKAAHATPVSGAYYATPKTSNHSLTAFKGPDAAENAYRSGMWLTASFARDPIVRDQALHWCQSNGMPSVVKYQSEGLNTAGGFLVPTEFSTAIIDLRDEFGTFRRESRVVNMSSESVTMPRRAAGVTAYYVGENSQLTESQKGWDQVTLTAKKLACLTRMSTELAEDAAINVADDLAREMAYAFAVAEDQAGWNGDGTSSYGGIQGVKTKFVAGLATFVGAVDLTAGVDTIGELTAAEISRVMSVLPAYARRNAKFYMSQQMWDGGFQRLIAAMGGNSTMTMGGAVPLRYLGYPVVIDQTLPSTGTIDSTPMWYFGDLSLAARMGSRRDIRVVVSSDRYMEYDQIGIQATERFDIVVHDIGDASAAGPIVAAMGNTS